MKLKEKLFLFSEELFQQPSQIKNKIKCVKMAKPTVQFTDEVQTIDLTASTWETTVLVYHDVRLKADDGKFAQR